MVGKGQKPDSSFSLPPGLEAAIKEVPSLIVPIWLSYAALEAVFSELALDLPSLTVGSFQSALAVVVGLILYTGGNFWDETIFGPRYSLRFDTSGEEPVLKRKGRWLDRDDPPWGVFPPGKPLQDARMGAAEGCENFSPSGYGGYRKAKEVVKEAGRWNEVEGPLLLSKFVRSFLWPMLIVGVGSTAMGAVKLTLDEVGGATYLVWGGAVLIGFGLTTIPYFHFQVEHMTQLYELAMDQCRKRVSQVATKADQGGNQR